MAASETMVHLAPEFFGEREKILLETPDLSASAFRYDSGVCAVRLRNDEGEIVMLPYQGQQIWSARFRGRELTMKSMFDQPKATREYLETYGGFLLHCGATAMGVPSEGDSHPLHGELPNAPYQAAYLVVGADEEGDYLGLGGVYQHTVAFTCNYRAEPLVKLHVDSSVLDIGLTITNLRNSPMEWMYLAHLNFRPVEDAQLIYSAPCTPEHCRVRKSIPSHITPPPGYAEFLGELEADPEKHNRFSSSLPFNPEVCFYLDYVADDGGWAHSLQVLPDGEADYVAHRPEQLDKVIRWIALSEDQAAMGLALPATAEPEGLTAEKGKGNIKALPAKGSVRIDMRAGALGAEMAEEMEKKIGGMV